jgi:competence protein ComEC
MKLPAAAIAAAFACGAVLGQMPFLRQRAASHSWLIAEFVAAALLIASGLFLTKRGHLTFAAGCCLSAWLTLGFAAAAIAEQPLPADHILTQLDTGKIDLRTPLRWHGHLRDESAHHPWGYAYEVELSAVEYQGTLVPAQGGLRVSFYEQQGRPIPPDVHAGDEIVTTAHAKRPPIFRDDGAFDRRAYLADRDIHLVGTLRAPQLMQRVGSWPARPGTLLAHVRGRLREELDMLFANQPQVGGVLRAMLLGDRSFVERDESTDFQKTGVFHVLVVAGLHVGAFAVFLFWIGRKFKFAPLWTALATLVLLGMYVAVVEERPPVLRAALMTGIVVLGGLFFRRLEILNSASIAALILLVAKPLAVRDSSFQLTFLAMGCIAGLALPWLEKNVQPYLRALRGWRDVTRDGSHEPHATQFRIDLRSVTSWLGSKVPSFLKNPLQNALVRGIVFSLRVWELLIITIVLQIGMLPLMASDFHRITLSAPLVNLAAVPLTSIVVPLGLLTLGTGLLFFSAAKLLAAPLSWLVLLLLRLVQWFAHLPRWSYRIPGPPIWLIALFLVAALLLCVCARVPHLWRGWAWRSAAAAIAAGTLAIAIFPFSPRWSTGKLELTVLDIGQGDSLFVVSPHGRTLLVDGGGGFAGFPGEEEHSGVDPGEEAVSPYLWSRGFQKLDVVALTHAHQDHIGGLFAVLQNFHVGTLWIGREVSSTALVKLENVAREKAIPVVHEWGGNSFSWDGIQTRFLWPELASEEISSSSPPKNDDSLVFRLQFGKRSLMLPGDAEKQSEKSILRENSAVSLQADVLKVGHHGSKNSTTDAFLAAVHPSVAIISAGEDNSYGHPHRELLDRLEAADVRILRTDRDGAVHVLTDGQRLEISCFVPCLLRGASAASSARTQPPDQQQNAQQ